MTIVNLTHRDLDGVVSSILINDWCEAKGFEFTKIPATYRNIDDIFKRFYNQKDFFIISDISINNEDVIPNIEDKNNILIIDHHPRKVTSKIKKQVLRLDEGAGCRLTYKYLEGKGHKFSKSLERLMILGNDFDLYKNNYKASKIMNHLFFFYNFRDFFERFKCGFTGEFLESEKKFLLYKQKEIRNILDNISYDTLSPRVAFTIAFAEIDEVAEHIIKKYDFECVVIYNPNMKTLSFRSKMDSIIDLGLFLNKYKGGGHAHAAGVSITDDNQIADILEKFVEVVEIEGI